MNKHVHYNCIVAWATGQHIEYYSNFFKDWKTCEFEPSWDNETKFRIAMPPKKKVKMWKALIKRANGNYQDSISYYTTLIVANKKEHCNNMAVALIPYTEIEVEE